MGSSTALSALVIVFLTVAAVQAQNSTDIKLGWQDGPNQRGTLTLVWGCLSTIIACTWTILHPNIPGPLDDAWTKTSRKAKWMLITILFPEFVFSKSICELQMAVDDLHAMKEKEDVIKWEVQYSPGLKFLHKLFHCLESLCRPAAIDSTKSDHEPTVITPKESPPPARTVTQPSTHSCEPVFLPATRLWTLTHSYFANMGGLLRYHNSNSAPITAHALVNCCAGTGHDPLPSLVLHEKDIEDKSKADWLLKSIAVAQISWLILSMIVRAAKKLPISQLEICTTAFAILAIATYIATWSKPKDIEIPVRFKLVEDAYECGANNYEGEPFFRRLLRPSESRTRDEYPRIRNDYVRLEGFMPPMAIYMAISTAFFGGLHCLAWNFEFPTKTELMIWMVGSVASATIPTAALIANMIVVSLIRHAVKKSLETLSEKFQEWKKTKERQQQICRTENVPESTVIICGPRLITTSIMPLDNYGSSLEILVKEMLVLQNDLKNYMLLGIDPRKVFKSYDAASAIWGSYDLARTTYMEPMVVSRLQGGGLTETEAEYLMHLVAYPTIMRDENKILQRVILPCDRVSRTITIIGGILYAAVRLMLLGLAFAALRSVPEGLYTATWTRFLPNIS